MHIPHRVSAADQPTIDTAPVKEERGRGRREREGGERRQAEGRAESCVENAECRGSMDPLPDQHPMPMVTL